MAKAHFYFIVLRTLRYFTADPKKALFLWASYRGHPIEMDDSNSPIRECLRVPCWQDRELLREHFQGEIHRCKDGKKEENFIKCALIRGVNVIATILESVPFYYQSCIRKTPSQQFSAGPASHYIGQGNIYSASGTGGSWVQTSSLPNLTILGAPLSSKGRFSHWITGYSQHKIPNLVSIPLIKMGHKKRC